MNSTEAKLATHAAYFYAGIVSGVLDVAAAHDWAYSVIGSVEAPPVALLEVATAHGRDDALAALAVMVGGDEQLAGRWLLADVGDALAAGSISIGAAVRLATRVSQCTRLPAEIEFEIESLAEEHQMAVDGVFGTPDDVLAALKSAFELHGVRQ